MSSDDKSIMQNEMINLKQKTYANRIIIFLLIFIILVVFIDTSMRI